MSKLKTQLWALIGAVLFMAALSNTVYADEYYRWVDQDGVVHYGSRPPEGVNAEVVNTWGKSAGTAARPNVSPQKAETTNPRSLSKDQQEVIAKRQEQCKEEQDRLNTLRSTGRRIQMQQPDGSLRYLTPEEVAQEISASEDFVNQACK